VPRNLVKGNIRVDGTRGERIKEGKKKRNLKGAGNQAVNKERRIRAGAVPGEFGIPLKKKQKSALKGGGGKGAGGGGSYPGVKNNRKG